MTSHSGPHVFFSGPHSSPYSFPSFLAPEIWKRTPVAPRNQVLGQWIICSIFILLVPCLSEVSVDLDKCAGQPVEAETDPVFAATGKKVT